MQRYRAYGPTDDPPIVDGDAGFLGVDQYTTPENLEPGMVQDAVNMDFSTQDAVTRGGFVCIPSMAATVDDFLDSWTLRTTPVSKTWLSVAYGNGVLVAICSGAAGVNDVMRSVDSGVTWTSVSTGTSVSFSDVTYAAGLFVAVGSTIIYTSADGGQTWTSRSNPGRLWTDIAYGNGLFVAIGYAATGPTISTFFTYSSDGITWSAGSSTLYGWTVGGICYGGGYFIALGNQIYDVDGPVAGLPGAAFRSSDGSTFTGAGNPGDGYQWAGVAYGVSRFVGVTSNGTSSAALSTDAGVNWSTQTTPSGGWNSVRYLNGYFIATAATGSASTSLMTSALGSSWVARTAASGSSWVNTAATGDRIVAVATNGHPNQVMTSALFPAVWATGVYSDPNDAGSQWVMLVQSDRVTFNAFGKTPKTITYAGGQTVSELSTVVQANNKVYIFRGSSETPLVWDGSWANTFTAATGSIPDSNMAVYSQNRLWAIVGKDSLYASDILDFTAWTEITNQFNLSTGDSNYLVTAFPFGDSTLIVFKNRSILALQGVDGALTDVVATEITRQVGAVGINAVVSVGPDLVYVSNRNINLLSLTQTNNAIQHKTLPLSTPIKKIFDRVNWEYGYKISMGYWDNKIYVSLPLDNATSCSTVVVYNFVTQKWYGEWNFDSTLSMSILGWEIADYLGLQRLHAITEDGRIFVVGEGWQDISGDTVAEISASLTTRAYPMNNENRVNRRMWVDLATWRPNFSVTGYVDGVSEYTRILIEQTFVRTMSWIFGDSYYDPTNANDDYNREGRKDYAGYPGDNIEAQSGFLPEAQQEYRLPILFRRKGRLVWYNITNTQGKITVSGVGGEARAGDRSSYTQII
jgi:hypothetical protein